MDTKTPDEMAEEYCEDHDECEHARNAFLAGYQAAKDQLADADKVIPKWNSVDAVGDSIDRSAIQHALAVLKKKPFPQWISVKDRLPEEDKKVQILINYFLGGTEVREVAKAAFRNGLWSGDKVYITHPLVSHWMPLPEAPKE